MRLSYTMSSNPKVQKFISNLLHRANQTDKLVIQKSIEVLGSIRDTDTRSRYTLLDDFIMVFIEITGREILERTMYPLLFNLITVVNPNEKNNRTIRLKYLHHLIRSCYTENIIGALSDTRRSLLFKSFLIKIINEKVYEEIGDAHFREIIQSKEKRKKRHITDKMRSYHFIEPQVDIEKGTHSTKLLLRQLSSSLFEELVHIILSSGKGIDNKKSVCCIHLPDAGDILFSTGETVEVKCNPKAVSSIKRSNSQYGVTSAKSDCYRRTSLSRTVRGRDPIVKLCIDVFQNNDENKNKNVVSHTFRQNVVRQINQDILQAVELSGIRIPFGTDITMVALLNGIEEQEAGNPVLRNAVELVYPQGATLGKKSKKSTRKRKNKKISRKVNKKNKSKGK